MFSRNQSVQISKDKLKTMLNNQVNMTNRFPQKKSSYKSFVDSINDENHISLQSTLKHEDRKYSYNDVITNSEKKIIFNAIKSPNNKSTLNTSQGKFNIESPESSKYSIGFGLPQIQKLKTEQSGYDLKRNDSSILTINTNEQLMDAQIERNSNLQNNFKQLCIKVLNMLDSLKNNDKMEETLEELLQFLMQTSRTEIELSKMVNVALRQSSQISQINLKNQKLNNKIQFFQDRYNITNSKNDEYSEKYLKSIKETNTQKKIIQNQKKKVDQLEQRLDFILQTEFLSEQNSSNQNLRKVLTELVKENESLKRENTRKDQEVKRLIDQNSSLNQKLNLMNQKIESMKSKISMKDLEEIYYDTNQIKVTGNTQTFNDPTNILQNDQIPEKLDFRINQLRTEYKQLIVDLCEHGSNIFIEQYQSMDDKRIKKELIKLILQQFLSYKEFSERNNKIFQMIHHIEKIDSFDELLCTTNSYLKKIFKCNSAHIWIYDSFTGILYTLKEDKTEMRALNTRGLFSEIIRHQLAANKNEDEGFLIYEQVLNVQQNNNPIANKQRPSNESQGNWVYSNTSLCIPLFSQIKKKQIIGILEISGTKNKVFSSDDEYCAVLFAQFLSNYIKREKAMENRYKDFLQEAFLDFIQCKDKISFTNSVAIWLQRIFTISQFRIYFVKNNKLYNYKNEEFTNKHGWAGYVLQINQAVVVQNIKSSENYDPNVDMYSILPIEIRPLSHNNQLFAIIEFPIKKCNRTPSVSDDFTFGNSPIMGLDNSFNNAMKQFCKHISIALKENKIE